VKTRFQSSPFKCNLQRYSVVSIATVVPAGGLSPTSGGLDAKIVIKDAKNNAATAAAANGALTAGITAVGPTSDAFDAAVTPTLQSDGSYLADFSSSGVRLKAETTYWVSATYSTQAVGSPVALAVGVADSPSVAATRFAGGGVPSGVAVVAVASVAAGVVADASFAAVPAVAGVPEVFTLTLHDAAGNRVKAARGVTSIRAFLMSTSVTLPAAVTFDAAADVYRVNYTATSARDVKLHDVRLEIRTAAGELGLAAWKVLVYPNAPSAAASSVSPPGGAIEAATLGEVFLDLKDSYGNPWAQSLMPIGTPQPDIVLQLTGPIGDANPLLLSSNNVDGSVTLAEVAGAAAAAAAGQPTYAASFRVTAAGSYLVTAAAGGVTFGLLGGGGAAVTIVIAAGPISALTTSASGAGLSTATAGGTATVYINPRDAFGNPCLLYDAAGNRVERSLELAAAPGPGAPRGLPSAADFVDVAAAATTPATALAALTGGVYALTYNVTQAGTLRITLEARNPVRDVIRAVVSGSPALVTVKAGSPAAAGSVLTGSGVSGAVSGAPAEITLRVGDRFGNAVASSGSVPTVDFTPPVSAGGTVALTPAVGFTDHGDGTFSLRYVVSITGSSTATAFVAVTLAGALVTSGCQTPFAGGCAITVVPASAAASLMLDPAKTTADGPGLFHGEAGAEMVFYAYPRSAAGVPIDTPGLDIVLELSGPSGSPAFALTQRAFAYDAALGRYVARPVVVLAGEYDVKVTAGGGVSVAAPAAAGASAWPVVVSVRPGPTSPSMSTYALTAGVDAGGGSAAAGVPATLTFYPKDALNNSQTYGPWRDVDAVTAEVSPGPLATSVVFTLLSARGGGAVLTAPVTVNVAAAHTLGVAVNGAKVLGGGPTAFPVSPSAVDPEVGLCTLNQVDT
jgi:hypothetical protein